ncbi:LppM family (lipo)protein [Allokutzneria oryzae]|uniref:LppM family (Lipo)protein n=1 Tax=Allokutzneria oryzae TaxID=1378989 RepID=A0ABV5ZNM0_9PSEU
MPTGPRRRAVLVLALLTALLLSGCVRARMTLSVSEDDRVTGDLQVLAAPQHDGDAGPQLVVPTELAGRARVTKASAADGFTGSQLTFTGLTFEELRLLSATAVGDSGKYRFGLRRSGGLVTLSGSVDLTQLAPDRTDVQIKVNFPGKVNSGNGRARGNEISWSPKAGQVTELTALARYADATTEAWVLWAIIVGAGTGCAAVTVMVMAYVSHRRHRQSFAWA